MEGRVGIYQLGWYLPGGDIHWILRSLYNGLFCVDIVRPLDLSPPSLTLPANTTMKSTRSSLTEAKKAGIVSAGPHVLRPSIFNGDLSWHYADLCETSQLAIRVTGDCNRSKTTRAVWSADGVTYRNVRRLFYTQKRVGLALSDQTQAGFSSFGAGHG